MNPQINQPLTSVIKHQFKINETTTSNHQSLTCFIEWSQQINTPTIIRHTSANQSLIPVVNHSTNNLFTTRPTKCIVNHPDSQPTRQTCRRNAHKQGKKQKIATNKSSERKGNESQRTWRNDFEKESRREQTRKAKEKQTRTPSHGRNLCTNPCAWSSMLKTICFLSLLAMKVYYMAPGSQVQIWPWSHPTSQGLPLRPRPSSHPSRSFLHWIWSLHRQHSKWRELDSCSKS